ncbi:hypothetical protein CRM22_000533, partial [Opisthorchis felineus]
MSRIYVCGWGIRSVLEVKRLCGLLVPMMRMMMMMMMMMTMVNVLPCILIANEMFT